MPYDNLNDRQLAREAREWANRAENNLQGAMRRLDELDRRMEGESMPVPTPAPAPSPAPFADVNYEDHIIPGGIHETGEGGAVGAFRFISNVAKLGYIDPIVHPGTVGKSHLHLFWGNTEVNENSTFESLASSGESTSQGSLLNRSAYWVPALVIDGMVWQPDWISNYYKLNSPEHLSSRGINSDGIRPYPNGMKLVFGNTHHGSLSNRIKWKAHGPNEEVKGEGRTLADIAPLMSPGDTMIVSISAGMFWDGRLESEDHRSHVTRGILNPNSGQYEQPLSHPYVIPTVTFSLGFTVPSEITDVKRVRLDSDMVNMPAGHSFHADIFTAHHPIALSNWHEHALLRQLNCSGADYGNGDKGIRPPGFTFNQRPNFVPVPA